MDALLAEGRPLDLRRDVWPLMAKEIGYGHYHELFHAHPARTTLPREDFAAAYDRLGWTEDPLLRGLHRSGALAEEVVTDPAFTHRSGLLTVSPADGRLVDSSLGGPHPRRIALGAPTNSRAVAAFARPRTDSPGFRQNDAVARALLRALAGVSPAADPASVAV
ncbi:hypothetical protein ACPCAG_18580 [Streptomyces pseudogriseolus]|uniref:hypothetical protein n=1 Tax=Streptomyces pseudogriseolus TaxID=36817 RepID=UPI003FA203F0